MKRIVSLRRAISNATILVAFLGALAPLQGATAAGTGQEPGDGWVILPSPPAHRVHVDVSPAQLAPEGQASAGITPQGSDVAASAAPTDLVIYRNSILQAASDEAASPSAANNGRDIFAAYTESAGLSVDYGQTWSFMSPMGPNSASCNPPSGPGTVFCETPGAPNGGSGFGGNQDVFYDPGRDVMVWTVLYDRNSAGNTLGMAVSTGRFDLEAGNWTVLYIGPSSFCGELTENGYFDSPVLTRTNNYLYLAANVFKADDSFACSSITRIPLDSLASGIAPLTVFHSGKRNLTPAQGGTTVLYFATHETSDKLRIYTWPESKPPSAISNKVVSHPAYVASGYTCLVGADNPCADLNARIRTAWVRMGKKQLAFMWDAAQDVTHPFPFTRAVIVNTKTKTLRSTVDISSADFAYVMSSSAINARGHVGGTIMRVGGTVSPSCSVWVNDDISGMPAISSTALNAATGDTLPSQPEWGQYLRARRSGYNPFQWVGTCYAIQSGNVVPRFVRFGRQRDALSRMKGDYNVDGKSDLAYFRPSNGDWNVKGQFVRTAGQVGDIPIPGDYDGDGRTDVAVFRPPDQWRVPGNPDFPINFGSGVGGAAEPGDIPVPGDYNGDGKTDVAIYNKNSGNWVVKDQFTEAAFSVKAIPVPADYDGDGKTDVAIFKPSLGKWKIRNQTPVIFGKKGDIPVPGDYNGDGKAEPAFFRPSDGTWHILGRPVFKLGQLGDIPVPGDFNADGKTDAAFFRPSNGAWKIKGKKSITFGKLGDFPLLAPDTNGDGDPYQ